MELRDYKIRFRDTIILHKNIPFYVEDITEADAGINFMGSKIDNGKWKPSKFIYNSKNVDITMPEEKFFNGKLYAVYIFREAQKQYRRGFQASCMHLEYISEPAVKFLERPLFKNVSLTSSAVVQHMYFPKYPSLKDTIKELGEGKRLSMAFSKKWALGIEPFAKSLVLFYKFDRVGRWSKKENKFVLSPNMLFLREDLMETTGMEVRVGEQK